MSQEEKIADGLAMFGELIEANEKKIERLERYLAVPMLVGENTCIVKQGTCYAARRINGGIQFLGEVGRDALQWTRKDAEEIASRLGVDEYETINHMDLARRTLAQTAKHQEWIRERRREFIAGESAAVGGAA